MAAGAYEAARSHLHERSVKGASIGDHEALQFRVADLSAKVEAARALVYRACADTNPRSFLPFQAKLFATEIALDVTRAAVQLGGATHYAEGSRIERLARDAYAATLHFENNDFLRAFMGRSLVKG
jgi:alkylation response protein AidB-like acyl-CoA dehydrogenase